MRNTDTSGEGFEMHRRDPVGITAVCLALVTGLVAGCGNSADRPDGGFNPTDAVAADVRRGDAGGMTLGGSDASTGTLTINPAMPVASVTIVDGVTSTPTLTLTATAKGSAVQATWSFDRPDLGSIGPSSGVFTPKAASGVGHVTATYASLHATANLAVSLHVTENGGAASSPDAGPGGFGGVGGPGFGGAVDGATKALLQGPAKAPATPAELGFLYPYDATVWPRGLLAPLLQWQTTHSATAVYIHLTEADFEFEGFYAGAALVNQPISASAWALATNGNTGDSLHAAVTIVDSGVAYGPIAEDWTVAPGVLQGTIYYSTYLSSYFQETAGAGIPGGAGVLAIRPGATSPTVAIPGTENACSICHTVSADGSTIYYTNGAGGYAGTAYDLRTGMATGEFMPEEQVAYAGSPYPNGSLIMPNSTQGDAPGDGYQGASVLLDRDSGTQVATTGWTTAIDEAVTPSFSPDGKSIAFNFWTGAGANGVTAGGGHELAIMDFACPSGDGGVGCGAPPYTFSNLRSVFSDMTLWPSWPSFTPDSQSLVFQALSDPGTGPTYIFTWLGARAQLYWTDVPAGATPSSAAALDALNGVQNGASYLPTSALHPDDTTLNYEPTVNTVPSGGYYWVVFTSRRLYGNVITADPFDSPFVTAGGVGGDVVYPIPKKLWVAAIDVNATPGKDRSHPAFYLPGQELNAINARGFWVVDPCKADGASCAAGDECCGGYCNGDGGLTCSTLSAGCSQEFDKCQTASDCCGAAAGYQCINHFCSLPGPK